jgi:hypothetical protein
MFPASGYKQHFTFYKGWHIYKQHSDHPVTGKWRAKKELSGISMGASTYEMLISMIETHERGYK